MRRLHGTRLLSLPMRSRKKEGELTTCGRSCHRHLTCKQGFAMLQFIVIKAPASIAKPLRGILRKMQQGRQCSLLCLCQSNDGSFWHGRAMANHEGSAQSWLHKDSSM
ncbi:unnamed protein product [Musa banksii]